MEIAIKRLSNENRQDFYQVHSDEVCGGWCFCAAWWVPTGKVLGIAPAQKTGLCQRGLVRKANL